MRKMAIVMLIASVIALPAFAAGQREGAAADGVVRLNAFTADFGISPLGTPVHEAWLDATRAYLQKDLEIEFTIFPWAQYGERINLTLASGDLPDIFTVPNNNSIMEYGHQGAIVDLAQHEDLIPFYLEYVQGTPAYRQSVYTPDGALYAFFDGNQNSVQGTQWVWAYRFDVFQDNGIKIPETLDEFLEAARALKSIYPDSYPVSSSIANNQAWYSVQRPFFHVNHADYTHFWDGTQFVYGPTTEGYRDALRFIAQLYSEGLLDPEFTVVTADQIEANALGGKNFIFPNFFGLNANRYNQNTESDAVWGIALPPENPKYGEPWMVEVNTVGKRVNTWTGIVVSAASRHIETAIRVADYQYSDEMVELMNWGIEGKTFRRTADGIEFLEEFSQSPDMRRLLAELGVSSTMQSRSGIIFTPQLTDPQYALTEPHPFFARGQYMEGNFWVDTARYGGEGMVPPFRRGAGMPSLTYSDAEREFRQINLTPVQTFVDESAIKFITGELSIERDWDNYLREMRRMGDIDTVTEVMTRKMRDILR